jgi:hypothetical protein
MGFWDWLTGDDESNSTTNTTTNALPAWQTEAAKSAVQGAQQLVKDRQYTPYAFPRIADFSPDQLAGFQATRDAVNSYKPNLDAASALMYGIGSAPLNSNNYSATTGSAYTQGDPAMFDAAAAQQYMNPYLNQVGANTMRALNEQKGIDQTGLNASSIKNGAFGGSRGAVAAQQLNKNYANTMGDQMAKLFSDGYTNAQGQFNTDRSAQMGVNTANQNAINTMTGINLGAMNNASAGNAALQSKATDQALSAASGLAGLGAQYQNLGMQGANALQGIGAQQQAQNQQSLDLLKNDFDNQQNYAYNQIKFLTDITNGVPSSQTQTSTTAGPKQSVGSAVGGLGLGLASLYNMFSGS